MIIFSRAGEIDKLNLFTKLNLEFVKQNKKSKVLSFDYSDKYFYRKYNCDIIKVKKIKNKIKAKEYSDSEIKEMLRFEYEKNKNLDLKKAKTSLFEYLNFLDNLNKKEKIEFCIIWNNSFFFDRILYFFCKKNRIKFAILEQGYFRPFTLSLDFKGVNADASIVRDKNIYENILVDKQNFKENLTRPLFAKLNNDLIINKSIYRIYQEIDKLNIFQLDKIISISEDNILKRLKRKIIKKIKNKKIDKTKIKKINFDVNTNVQKIFIPFQVETDSQIIFNSSKIKKMSELYKIVGTAVREINKTRKNKVIAIFKSHPMDHEINIKEILNLETEYENTVFLTEESSEELIKNSEIVITINSTVGVEALLRHKKVITLGDAFYNIDGIVHHCNKPQDLEKILQKVLSSEVNKELIDKFLYYLRFDYFKEIYWRNPDEDSIKKIVQDIIYYLEDKRKKYE